MNPKKIVAGAALALASISFAAPAQAAPAPEVSLCQDVIWKHQSGDRFATAHSVLAVQTNVKKADIIVVKTFNTKGRVMEKSMVDVGQYGNVGPISNTAYFDADEKIAKVVVVVKTADDRKRTAVKLTEVKRCA